MSDTTSFRGDWFTCELAQGWRSNTTYRFGDGDRLFFTIRLEGQSREFGLDEHLEARVARALKLDFYPKVRERSDCAFGSRPGKLALIDCVLGDESEGIHCLAVSLLTPRRLVIVDLECTRVTWDEGAADQFAALLRSLEFEGRDDGQ
jgi:hypothetical protein